MLAVGIFANGKYGAGWNATVEGTAATASGVTGHLRATSVWACVSWARRSSASLVIWTVMFGLVYVWFKLSDMITPIRSREEDELVGLDLPEMGVLAYPDFLGHGGVPSPDGAPVPARVPEHVG